MPSTARARSSCKPARRQSRVAAAAADVDAGIAPNAVPNAKTPPARQAPDNDRGPASSSAPVIPVLALLILCAAFVLMRLRSPPPSQMLLRALAEHQFAWTASTTAVPISSVSVLAKHVLSGDTSQLPTELHAFLSAQTADSLAVQPLRDFSNAQRLTRVRALCARSECDVNAADPQFGLTPLHLAAMTGDTALTEFLAEQGAKPIDDAVGRRPANLSFANFIANAKRARAHHETCDFPIVDFSPGADLDHARHEAARLVGEGEPVLLRSAFAHYAELVADADTPSAAEWDVEQWVARFAHVQVVVGAVPYAAAFNLSTTRMSLREYYDGFVRQKSAENVYVFNKVPELSGGAYAAIVRLIEDALPMPQLLVHPDQTGGVDGMHFFFGRPGSGAPFHIHADAINVAVNGRKKWFVFTPQRTIYSRKTIKQWVDEDLTSLTEEDRPLECLQSPGDAVYIPLDWGHGVLNLDENTYGFALEVLNRRDTLSHLWRVD